MWRTGKIKQLIYISGVSLFIRGVVCLEKGKFSTLKWNVPWVIVNCCEDPNDWKCDACDCAKSLNM